MFSDYIQPGSAGFSFDHIDHNELLLPLSLNIEELGVEHHWKPRPRNDLVWGLDYRASDYNLTSTPSVSFQQTKWDLNIYAAFATDEITLGSGSSGN